MGPSCNVRQLSRAAAHLAIHAVSLALLSSLLGRTAGPRRRRSARSLSRRPIGAEQLESRAILAGVDINGGLSWTGWTSHGLSNAPGVYGSGGVADSDERKRCQPRMALLRSTIGDGSGFQCRPVVQHSFTRGIRSRPRLQDLQVWWPAPYCQPSGSSSNCWSRWRSGSG